jgi:diguanylate cyclase (GGDEF)-like protein
MAFIQSQSDYITFLYGLIFVILGGVALIQKFIGYSRINWAWLGFFGLLHGVYEWIQIFEAAFPAIELIAWASRVVGLASLAALIEFARVNWRPPEGDAVESGDWWRSTFRHWPVVAFLLASYIGLGVTGSVGWLIMLSALAGGAWSALMLAMESRAAADRIQGRWLLLGAGSLGAFSLCLTVMAALKLLSQAALLPVGYQLSALGVAHTLFAVLTTLAVWGYIRRGSILDGSELAGAAESAVAQRRYTLWLSTSLVIVLAIGWYATEKLGQNAADSIRERSRGATGILASHLRDEMARTDLMAALLAKSPHVLSGLEKLDPETLVVAAAAMRQHTAVLENSVAFLMAPNGRVLASTDEAGPKNQSENFGFLPYFHDSSAYGLVGKDLAVEPDLEQRGYYVSHPVTGNQGRPVGVTVVKKVLAQTDKEFKNFRNWFLVSPAGVVFLSSRPELLLQPLWALSESKRQQLVRSGEFGPGPFTGAKLERAPVDRDSLGWEGEKALANIVEVRPDGWSAVIIETLHPVVVQRLYGILATLAVALFTLCFFVVVQRETAYKSKLALDQRRLEALNAELERQATTDNLTGLYNRLKFNALLMAEIDRANRYDAAFSLVMFDVDHFKRVNDAWGHQTGDTVLVTLARLAKDTMRSSDSLARWGGEEFIAILPMTKLDGALYFSERIKQALATFAFEPVPEITCSFGVTEYVLGDSPESIVARADRALYLAKENGRNRIEIEFPGSAV